jgi:hypothetical protein
MELRFYVREDFIKEYRDAVHIFTDLDKLLENLNFIPKVKKTVLIEDNLIIFIFSHQDEKVLQELVELMKTQGIIQLEQPAAISSETKSLEELRTAELRLIGRISIKYGLWQEKI